jgi:UDP-2-acetamido-3-amino-2,3-dideoxy-glucuronate N-acetyltransferase
VQNNVSFFPGTIVEHDVFVGPSCVFTNVKVPRADWHQRADFKPTRIRSGATIGANATIVCGITIGRHAFVAAGAVVTRDVADYALVMGVPAVSSGFMSRHGARLHFGEGREAQCSVSKISYRMSDEGRVSCLDVHEDARLPSSEGSGENA